MTKRTVDILAASLGLIMLAPVFGLLWILIRIKLGTPVIVTQRRPGRDGELITVRKFRTVREDDPASGVLTDDQAATSFGRGLQASNLAQLPALVNVLNGEMSLVGPRPLNVEYLALYSPHQARRHEVRPGLTGLAQVNDDQALTWETHFDFDVHYVDHHTLWMDLKVIILSLTRTIFTTARDDQRLSTMMRFVGAPPHDGLTEEPVNDRWDDLWDSWQRSTAARKIGNHEGADPNTTRHWVYLDDHEIPIGIAGLSGLGGPELYASLVLGPNHNTPMTVETLLHRLLHNGKVYDAHRIFLRLSETSRELLDRAQQLGFVPIDLPSHRPHIDEGEVLVAFAAQTGT